MTDVTTMDRQDRDILDHYAAGNRPRTIATALDLEVAFVTDTINVLSDDDRTVAARLVAQWDQANPDPAAEPPTPADPGPAEAPLPGPDEPPTEIADRITALLAAADAERRAIDGIRDPLPEPDSVEALLTAGEHADGAADVIAAAAAVRAALGELSAAYAAERRRREIRTLVLEHRCALDDLLAELADLEAAGSLADPDPQPPATTAARTAPKTRRTGGAHRDGAAGE